MTTTGPSRTHRPHLWFTLRIGSTFTDLAALGEAVSRCPFGKGALGQPLVGPSGRGALKAARARFAG